MSQTPQSAESSPAADSSAPHPRPDLDQLVEHDAEPQLQRHLTNRHVQLIAIGGAIGTGLFMGSGKTISLAGPGVFLVYAVIGAILFLVMRPWARCCCPTCPTSPRRRRPRPHRAVGRLLRGLDLLRVLAGDGCGRGHRHHRVREVLVAAPAARGSRRW